MIEAEPRSATRWELSPEGEEVLREGSPEVRLFRSLPEEGLPQAEALVGTGGPERGDRRLRGLLTAAVCPQKLPGGSLGFSKAMANKWVRLDKGAAGGPRVMPTVSGTGRGSWEG